MWHDNTHGKQRHWIHLKRNTKHLTATKLIAILQWRHNKCDGVSNYRRLDCLLNGLFRCRSKKTSKLRVTGLCEGNSPVTGEFPAQRASNAENVSIWWRHHEGTIGHMGYPPKLIWNHSISFALILIQLSNYVKFVQYHCHALCKTPKHLTVEINVMDKNLQDGFSLWCVCGENGISQQPNGYHMTTSSNGNIFRVTGHLCGEFTGLRWIPHTKASDAELWCFLSKICV